MFRGQEHLSYPGHRVPRAARWRLVERLPESSANTISSNTTVTQSGGARTWQAALQFWKSKEDRYWNKYSAWPDTLSVQKTELQLMHSGSEKSAIIFVQINSWPRQMWNTGKYHNTKASQNTCVLWNGVLLYWGWGQFIKLLICLDIIVLKYALKESLCYRRENTLRVICCASIRWQAEWPNRRHERTSIDGNVRGYIRRATKAASIFRARWRAKSANSIAAQGQH